MKIRISLKIFFISISLLVLMGAAAIFSMNRLGHVKSEIDAISLYYVKLIATVAEVEAHVLEQQLILERTLRHRLREGGLGAGFLLEKADFEKRSRQVIHEIELAQDLCERAGDSDNEALDKSELQYVWEFLEKLKKQHQKFHDRSLGLLSEEDPEQREAIHSSLEGEEDSFDKQLEELRVEVTRFIERSSLIASKHESHALHLNVIISAAAALIGLLASLLVIRGMVKPIHLLLEGTRQVNQGQLEVRVPITSKDEIGLLTHSFNRMVHGLRLKERIKDTFGKYVDPRIVEELIEHKGQNQSGGEKRVMTVFFSDIEGFTSISEKLSPDDLVRFINDYLSRMSEVIHAESGVIDKFIGDAIMAYWGPPFCDESRHAILACRAALKQKAAMEIFRTKISGLLPGYDGSWTFNVRMGVATGEMLVGNIGSDVSRGYTVMGDTVNLASRLEGVNKNYKTHIMISESVKALIVGEFDLRRIDRIRVKGKTEPVEIFELMGERNSLDIKTLTSREFFEKGLDFYRLKKFSEARQNFHKALEGRPDDTVSRVYLERIEFFEKNPPPLDWDGVWTFTSK